LLAADHVYVVPPSRLLPLPFEALPIDDEAFLADRVAITYLPDASALRLLEERPAGSGPMVVFADPSSDAALDGSPTLRSAALIPLPEARKEARHVATKDATLWIGSAARTERVAESGSSSVLHFATHAVVDEFSRASTGLLLAGPHGLLTPDDIAAVPLRADLVALSGCRTVGGSTYLGEGTFGVARSFLVSGARSVVTSAWDVEDGAARRFMELFYQNLREGRARDESLRLAQAEMKRQGYPLRDRCAFTLTGVGHAPVAALAGAAPLEAGGITLPIWIALGLAAFLLVRLFLFKSRRHPA
jgi:CHAT domain-containing protein